MSRALVRKQEAMVEIQQQHRLKEIQHVEPKRLEQIVDLALMQPLNTNRWVAYERLKRMSSRIVGWGAERPELKTSAHYTAMVDFINYLLPEEMEGVDEPIGLSEGERSSWLASISDILAATVDDKAT